MPKYSIVRVTNLPQQLVRWTQCSISEADQDRSDGFPGLIVKSQDLVVAAMGYQCEVPATLVLTNPVLLTHESPDILRDILLNLFQEVPAIARELKCTFVRLLRLAQPQETQPLLTEVLKCSGFLVRARIICWRVDLSACPVGWLDGGSLSAEQLRLVRPLELQQSEPLFRQVTSLLQEILSESPELAGLPRASAAELVARWISEDCIFLLAIGPEILGRADLEEPLFAGLVVLYRDALTVDSAGWQIQYVGVRPQFRRRSLATQMLRSVIAGLRKLDPSRDTVSWSPGVSADSGLQQQRTGLEPSEAIPLPVRVYSDRQNIAATALYQGLGFVPEGDYDVWCLETPALG